MMGTQYPRVDVDFSATSRTEETVQIVLTRDETNALNITAGELVLQARFEGSGLRVRGRVQSQTRSDCTLTEHGELHSEGVG